MNFFKSASPAATTTATPATKVGGKRRSEKRNRKNKNRSEKNQMGGEEKNKNRSEKNQMGGGVELTDEETNRICTAAGWKAPETTATDANNATGATTNHVDDTTGPNNIPTAPKGGKRRNKNRSEKRNRKNKNRRSSKNRKN